MRRIAPCVLCVILTSCATHYVRRAPEPERSSYLTHQAIHEGMTTVDIMRTVIDLRGVEQEAVLESKKGCEPTVRINLQSGPWPRNFALISIYSTTAKSLRTHGFDRQRDFLEALASGEGSMRGCGEAVLAFNTAIEGGCGYEAIDLALDAEGRVTSVGTVYERPSCLQ